MCSLCIYKDRKTEHRNRRENLDISLASPHEMTEIALNSTNDNQLDRIEIITNANYSECAGIQSVERSEL